MSVNYCQLFFSILSYFCFFIKLVYNEEACTNGQPFKKSGICTLTCSKNDIFIDKICKPVSLNEDDIKNMIEIIKNYITNLIPSDINNDIIIEGDGITYQITTNILIRNNNQRDSLIHLDLSNECLSSIEEIITDDYFIILINIINTNYTTYFTENMIVVSNDIEKNINEICLGKKISFGIPVSIPSSTLSIYDSIYEKYNYDIFNINDLFYNDICELYTTKDKTDMPLIKRIEIYGVYALDTCGYNCKYNKYDKITNKIFCDCHIQNGEGVEKDDKKNIGEQMYDKLKEFLDLINLDVMLCFKLISNSKKNIVKNIGFMIMTITTFLFILTMIITCITLKQQITKITSNFRDLKIKMKKAILETLRDIKNQIKQKLEEQEKQNKEIIENKENEKKEPQEIKIAPNNLKLNLRDVEDEEEEEEEEDDDEEEEEEEDGDEVEVENKKNVIKEEPKKEEAISKNELENEWKNLTSKNDKNRDFNDNNYITNQNNINNYYQPQPYSFDYNQYYNNLQNYYNYLNYYNYINAIMNNNMNNFYNNYNNNNNNNENNDESIPEQSEEEISPRNNNNKFNLNKLKIIIPYDKIKEKIKGKNKDDKKKAKSKNKTKNKTKSKHSYKKTKTNDNKNKKNKMEFEINFMDFFKQNPPKKVVFNSEDELSSKKDDNSEYNTNENKNNINMNNNINFGEIIVYDKNNNINNNISNEKEKVNENDKTNIKGNVIKKKEDKNNIELNAEEERFYIFCGKNFFECLKKIPEEKRLDFFTDEELNYLDYEFAVDYDKRSFCKQYFSLLRRQNILIFCFSFCVTDYNLSIIKVSFFLFQIVLHLIISAFFFTDNTLNNIYDKKNKFDFSFMIKPIGLTFIICFGINLLSKPLIRSDIKVIRIKEEKDMLNEAIKSIRLKFIFYFIISMIFIIFGWFYISCFCAVFNNTQIILFKCALYSFIANVIYPFIFCLLAIAVRRCAIGDQNKGKKCLYEFSKILSYI